MTDKERTVEFFRSLGIEPRVDDYTSGRMVRSDNREGRSAVVLDQENFGGYSGFEAVFEFDREGNFLPNKDNQSKDSRTGVWE